ncbi:MAG TPA: hypothetical protein VKW08_23915 [Xanthobacteraceae bacterium]|nr:hypothetical protein [Xanthobacteraceae bacterium]
MSLRILLGAIALTALISTSASAEVFDYAKYPNLKGQWLPIGGPGRFDISKPWGPEQEAPLTPEYQAVFQADLNDQFAGGQGRDRDWVCQSPGMPRVTNGYGQMEFVIAPGSVHILTQHIHDNRRIFTDGRDWPTEIPRTFIGYSIGRWIDSKQDGHFDVLEVETRGFKGPRSYDTSGLPLDDDNQTIVKERIYADATDRDVVHDQVTVIDHALTRPWTVMKNYHRVADPRPYWREISCFEANGYVEIGGEPYMLSGDGYLMPTKKNEPPPDLRYFKKP